MARASAPVLRPAARFLPKIFCDDGISNWSEPYALAETQFTAANSLLLESRARCSLEFGKQRTYLG